MAIGSTVIAGVANALGPTMQSGASGGNQDTSDPYAGGILYRIGGFTADPQTYFGLPRKIRTAKRNEKFQAEAQSLQLETGKANLEAQKLANEEEKRRQEWSRNLRSYLYGGRR